MENPGILNWRGWSLVPKAQAIGAATGVLITVGIPLVLKAYDGGPFAFLLLYLWSAVLSPAAAICYLFGWKWNILISEGASNVQVILAIVMNAFLLFLLGTLIGWIVGKLEKPQKGDLRL